MQTNKSFKVLLPISLGDKIEFYDKDKGCLVLFNKQIGIDIYFDYDERKIVFTDVKFGQSLNLIEVSELPFLSEYFKELIAIFEDKVRESFYEDFPEEHEDYLDEEFFDEEFNDDIRHGFIN